ncbi:MAG: AMP-binding protein [Actinomycetota bacterium]
MDGRFVWEPTEADVEQANVTRLMRAHGIETFAELAARSVADVAWFWDAVVRDLDIAFPTPYEQVVDLSRGPEWATWFTGGRTNLALQCLDRRAASQPDAPAVVWEGEDGEVRTATYAELRRLTDAVARALQAFGIHDGDTVAVFLPMAIETVAVVMACAKLGALWVPIFSGFGPDAVAARIADAGARVVVTADGSLRKGAPVPMKEVADRAVDLAGGVEHVLVWSRLTDPATPMLPGRDVRWDEVVDVEGAAPLDAPQLDAEHPLFVAYTSGTTGKPKGAVHVHGGFLVKIAEEVAYQVDLHPGELLHWSTDLGWIMGPWEIVGALALGATVLLTEGAPTHPGPDRLWEQVARHGVTTLGVSPTLGRALIAGGSDPSAHDRSTLRILASTGEPWNPDAYLWLHREVGGGSLPIVNLSGGTEVGACFLSPHPVVPTKLVSLGGPSLGMDLDVVGPDGRSAPPGAVGELVCRQPWPSMTRGIWGDPERYLDAYWRRMPGVWVHGDWASRDEDGFWFLHGRSDDTLNVAGKRLGPAEVESVLASHPDVSESAAVGVPDPVKGETIWCVVVRKPGAAVTEDELSALVGEHLGRSFAPSRVVFAEDLPKTRSAKIVRRAVRAVALGEDPGDLSSLENPGALDGIRRRIAAPEG